MRLTRLGSALLLICVACPPTYAEYVVLRSTQRLHVTRYQLNGDTYHLQLQGGTADIPAWASKEACATLGSFSDKLPKRRHHRYAAYERNPHHR